MSALDTAHGTDMPTPIPLWQKFARLGFVFLLIKGLLWLSAPALFYVFA